MQVVLTVRCYNRDICEEDPAIRGVTRIACTGQTTNFAEDPDILYRPSKVDQQMFFAKVPSHLTQPRGWAGAPGQPWLWVGREVTSSLTIADHLLGDEGMIIEHDEHA